MEARDLPFYSCLYFILNIQLIILKAELSYPSSGGLAALGMFCKSSPISVIAHCFCFHMICLPGNDWGSNILDGELLHIGWWVTAQRMVSYSTADGELQHSGWWVTAHLMGQNFPELVPEDIKTFVWRENIKLCFSRLDSTFNEVFIFWWNLPLRQLLYKYSNTYLD